ncbi:DUF4912 domain-containing protein [Effusibacillus consociatus]|uniref:DUF4912 domain-containing protein n=1 Tax=Effusibacillus consociatus TaxID=1117041 RepID=A0ABV9Q111_9BACL
MEGKERKISWNQIISKLEAGESQSSIAKEYGMTRGQFRYRLKKYLEQQQKTVMRETAVTTTERKYVMNEINMEALDPSLFDESWSRNSQTNRLVVMVKEPTALFAYWEIEEIRKRAISEHFQSAWTSLPFFLQVYDVTHIRFNGYNPNSTHRIPVQPMSDNWYIHGVEPGRNYQVDFGTTTLHGHFFTILRSNIVETPPVSDSRRKEPFIRFGKLHTGNDQGLEVSNQSEQADPSFDFQTAIRQTSVLDQPWENLFDGYTLSGQKGGSK